MIQYYVVMFHSELRLHGYRLVRPQWQVAMVFRLQNVKYRYSRHIWLHKLCSNKVNNALYRVAQLRDTVQTADRSVVDQYNYGFLSVSKGFNGLSMTTGEMMVVSATRSLFVAVWWSRLKHLKHLLSILQYNRVYSVYPILV